MLANIRSAPTFATALRAALLARAPELPASAVGGNVFDETVRACQAADLAYRGSIEANLSPSVAREVFAATDAFRTNVRAIRAGASAEASRVAPDVGDSCPDPLDVVTPCIDGLSHVAAVRLADVSDRARAQVALMRERANARIEPALGAAARAALIASKRARLAAFCEAVKAALLPFEGRIDRHSETVESLATLADGWF